MYNFIREKCIVQVYFPVKSTGFREILSFKKSAVVIIMVQCADTAL